MPGSGSAIVDQAWLVDVHASELSPCKVVTELETAGDFWEAEPEHQDYLEHYPDKSAVKSGSQLGRLTCQITLVHFVL